MIHSRISHTTSLLPDDSVLVTGGVSRSGVLNTRELYNSQTQTWMLITSMNVKRWKHTATVLHDGKVLVIGGYDGTECLSSAELYDPLAQLWKITDSITYIKDNVLLNQ
ncbi:unnamed protein product [Adineta ricciae]|nr:unnamed protein product [Adineta ricciae]